MQIGTTCRTTGWQDHATTFTADKQELNGFQVDNVGNNPWSVEKASGSITIKDARPEQGWCIVDPNGMPAGPAEGHAENGAYTLTLPSDALYVVLTGPGAGL